jgi:hypothetical protein
MLGSLPCSCGLGPGQAGLDLVPHPLVVQLSLMWSNLPSYGCEFRMPERQFRKVDRAVGSLASNVAVVVASLRVHVGGAE